MVRFVRYDHPAVLGSPGPTPMGTSFGLRNKPIPKRCPTTWNYPKKLSSGCLYSCCLMSFPRSQEHGSRARYAWDGLCTCEHGGGTWIHKKRYMAGTEHLLVICTWVILYPYIHIYIYIYTLVFLLLYCRLAVSTSTHSARRLNQKLQLFEFFHRDWSIIYRGYNMI